MFKNIFACIKRYFFNNKIYKGLKYGDILKVYIKKSKKFKFKGNHRKRPFIVIYNDSDYVCGVVTTHQISNDKVRMPFLTSMNSSAMIREIIRIKKSQILGKIGKLSESNLSVFSKKLSIYHKKSDFRNIFQEHITYTIGDIIAYNSKKYVIYYINSKEMTLIETSEQKIKNFIPLNINNKISYFSKECITIPCEQGIYLTTISGIELAKLKTEKKKIRLGAC